jgi:hypothetical protein
MPLLLDFRWAEFGVRSSLANVAAVLCDPVQADQVNPKFACFTSTKEQILTPTRLPGPT